MPTYRASMLKMYSLESRLDENEMIRLYGLVWFYYCADRMYVAVTDILAVRMLLLLLVLCFKGSLHYIEGTRLVTDMKINSAGVTCVPSSENSTAQVVDLKGSVEEGGVRGVRRECETFREHGKYGGRLGILILGSTALAPLNQLNGVQLLRSFVVVRGSVSYHPVSSVRLRMCIMRSPTSLESTAALSLDSNSFAGLGSSGALRHLGVANEEEASLLSAHCIALFLEARDLWDSKKSFKVFL
ncbi:hypothetical protein Tco_0008377 [Tanacetum coccineum]